MKQYFLFTMLFGFLCQPMFSLSQMPAAVSVIFADNKGYIGKVLQEWPTIIKIEFLSSHSIYEFNKQGKILSSNGKYAAGQTVRAITLIRGESSIYEYSSVAPHEYLGIMFSDAQIYYCKVTGVAENRFSCVFLHTGSTYVMERKGIYWIVKETNKGAYPPGHRLIEICPYDDSNKSESWYYTGTTSKSGMKNFSEGPQ